MPGWLRHACAGSQVSRQQTEACRGASRLGVGSTFSTQAHPRRSRIRYHSIDEFHIVLGAVRSAGSTNVHESSTSMWHPA